MIGNHTESRDYSRILLIEDNEVNRQMMSDYLFCYGYHVLSIAHGKDVFDAIATFQPQAILLDLKLPDISGYTLIRQIKEHPNWSNIPVIVVSAFAFQVDQQKALELGADDYLVKPIDLHQLRTVIETRIRHSESNPSI